MTTRARTTVTGFGAHATSAKAAPTSPQLVTIESHARLPWIASSSRRSPGDRASVHGLAGAAPSPGSTPVPYVGPRGCRKAVSIDEELAVKRDFFARLDDVVREQAIFATNTSTLTVGDIASATKRPERFVGLHFFNPVHAMKLVEVAPSLRTSPETVETCVAFAKRLGKAPVVVADSTGYIVNRLLVPYMVDAIACLERGLGSIADIDAAMQNGANHPMGPLALADFIGLDIVFHMSSLLLEEYREPRFTPPPLLRRMVLAGYLGRKSGLGFYDYKQTPPAAHDALG